MSFSKDHAIIGQNAATAAANVYAALVGQGYYGGWDVEVYEEIRKDIFNGSVALAGAEAVVESMESSTPARGRGSYQRSNTSQRRASGSDGDSSDNPATLVINSGKHEGKTLAEAYADDPDWFDWAADNLKNDFLRKKVVAFLKAA